MLSNHQLREEIVKPCLQALYHWTQGFEDLIVGTFAHESRFGQYMVQIQGPALGFWQMEPATYNDLQNYLIKFPETKIRIFNICQISIEHRELMVYNIRYACCMAIVKYLEAGVLTRKYVLDTPLNLAIVYKTLYNSSLGKATEQEFVDDYKTFCSIK